MVESLPSDDASAQKRRSTRIVQAVPITVSGVDALGQPFKERTTTVMVNCHGCKYQSKHYVPKNSPVTLEIPRPEPSLPVRTIVGRVIWVQRPRMVRELFQIGIEFETAGNVWGIAFPPEDWFPFPGDEPAPATPEAIAANAALPAQTSPEISQPAQAPPQAVANSAPAAEGKIHVVPTVSTQDAQLAAARQTAKMVAEAKETLDKTMRRGAQTAINEEMIVVRQQLDAQLHDAVERAIKVSMERVSESAVKRVVQQAAERTAAIVEEARKAGDATAAQLDAKIREAVDGAVSQAAEQAAQQAAQQATAQNLKQAVEEVVERVISQREAASPSLSILSSPDAAKQHLESWKSSLEDAAETVRKQSIDQTQTEAAAARERWQREFDAALTSASQDVNSKIADASQAALAQAERGIVSRQAEAHRSLDAAIADAQAKIESMGAALEQQRSAAESAREKIDESARNTIERQQTATEQARGQIEEAGRVTVEQARQKMVETLAEHQAEAARHTERLIAERLQGVEPALQTSAHRAVERFSSELDQKLAPSIEKAQNAASDLARAEQEANNLQGRIREQLQQAFRQAAQIESQVREQARKTSEEAAQAEITIRERVQQASQEALQTSLEQLRQESGKLPGEFEQSCRAVLSKLEEELEQRSTESQHETYEALAKAAEWYQKKAQTTMQTSLEKAVEQSTASLRNRAAEISSLAASELDHYRRSYVEHSQAEIEEAAKSVVERERGRMGESAEIAHATFSDRVQQLTNTSLHRFDEASRQALEKARSDMEYSRENSLTAFEQVMQEKMAQGVDQAQMQLQAQVGPLVDAWEAKRQQEQRQWLEQVKKSADESIEQYKARLENASNSWLLASATTLGQHSQAVLDTLAKAAEKRMRETIAEVLAGMGDTLKDRLLGISSQLGPDDEDDRPPKPKK